jgi:HD-GYP domain-containing protein (c-di-GMP phosphodiesterase class II)
MTVKPSPAAAWPTGFDVRSDPVFQERIRPFIDRQMEELAAFDRERAAWVNENMPADYRITYVFHEHAARVAADMRGTARSMNLPEQAAENLYWAMLPHDIGKKLLPLELWDMEEKPDDGIKALRRSHTEKGAEIARQEFGELRHPFIDLMLDIMLNHHEQMDGGGFRSLKAPELSFPVRLACIVESYDGYTIPRPHFGRRDISPKGVLKRMQTEKGEALYDMTLFSKFANYKLAAPIVLTKKAEGE